MFYQSKRVVLRIHYRSPCVFMTGQNRILTELKWSWPVILTGYISSVILSSARSYKIILFVLSSKNSYLLMQFVYYEKIM